MTPMKTRLALLTVCCLAGVAAVGSRDGGAGDGQAEPATAARPRSAEAEPAPSAGSRTDLLPNFPDFGYMAGPGEYHGRVFKLRQDFPKEKPALDERVKAILAIDFHTDWTKYLLAVRDYIYEGNIERDGYANDFYLEDNRVRGWYHVPWQHSGPNGREGVHGLTKEGPVNPHVLGPTQGSQWQTYAVGFYNPQGGWAIGRVWNDPQNPDVKAMRQGFPVGTVVGKVLFTTATVEEAPFLTAPIEWTAYVTPKFSVKDDKGNEVLQPRKMAVVRFIQMDVMVRDPRADATGGWVFGTFVYNGALGNENQWLNTVPVGIMWGNDPGVTSHSESNPTPTETRVNPDLTQTVINTSKDLPPMHLGWGLRLNGPVDNALSSCMSCHATAQYPAISGLLPAFVKKEGRFLEPGSPDWMRWFRNVPCATPFDAQAQTMDYSLQLAASVQNFAEATARANGGRYSVQYWQGEPVHQIRGLRGASRADLRE
jgi:hypothetical protein